MVKRMTSGRSVHVPVVKARYAIPKHAGLQGNRLTYGWTSSNWCGIVSRGVGGWVRMVSASWVVPQVHEAKTPSYSATWIGVDGYRNNDLIQVGTEQDYVGGKPIYYAWWEILPKTQTPIGGKVNPGDQVEARLQQLRPGKWLIRITNVTQNWTFQKVQPYGGPRASAEWIMEAPLVGGRLSNLSQFKQLTLTNCAVNNRSPEWTGGSAGLMVRNGVILCAPSVRKNGTVTISRVHGMRLRKRRSA